MKPAIAYFGQKWQLYPWLSNYFPHHDKFLDLFGGGGAISTLHPHCQQHIWNDIYQPSVQFYRLLQSQPDALIAAIHDLLTLDWPELKATVREFEAPDIDPVQQSARFQINSRISFAQTGTQAHTGWTTDRRKLSKQYLNPDYLHAIAVRWQTIQIQSLDFREALAQTPHDWFVYADPPYLWKARHTKDKRHNSDRPCRLYRHEFSDADHVDLIQLLQGRPAVLSGFASDLYRDVIPTNWSLASKRTADNQIEMIWISPEAMTRNPQLTLFGVA